MDEKPFEREVLDRLTKIEAGLESFKSAAATTYQNQRDIILLREKDENQQKEIESLHKEIDAMREDNKWLRRQIAGTVIGCIGTVIVTIILMYVKVN